MKLRDLCLEKLYLILVTYLSWDSAGIGMLLGRYKVIRMLGGNLELTNVNKQIEKIFEISGILKIIPLTKSEEICEYGGKNVGNI